MVHILLLVVLTRLGLFASCVAMLFSLYSRYGLTIDPHSWFFGESILTVGVFAAVAVYGFFVSLGGQKLFGEDLLGEMPVRGRA
jgi:hypothetical protein